MANTCKGCLFVIPGTCICEITRSVYLRCIGHEEGDGLYLKYHNACKYKAVATLQKERNQIRFDNDMEAARKRYEKQTTKGREDGYRQ